MTNAQLATRYREVAALYERLASLDMRAAKLEAFKGEQASIDSTRKQVQDELDKLMVLDTSSGTVTVTRPLDTSSGTVLSGIPIPPAQPPV